MKPINQILHDFWFKPAPASRLALLRLLLGAFVFGYLMLEFDDYLQVVDVANRLLRRGYSEEDVSGILGGNYLRLFEQVWR